VPEILNVLGEKIEDKESFDHFKNAYLKAKKQLELEVIKEN